MDVLQKQFSTSYEVIPMLSAALRLQESPENLADGEGMQVACMLELEGQGCIKAEPLNKVTFEDIPMCFISAFFHFRHF